jgi:hypothetical protein
MHAKGTLQTEKKKKEETPTLEKRVSTNPAFVTMTILPFLSFLPYSFH